MYDLYIHVRIESNMGLVAIAPQSQMSNRNFKCDMSARQEKWPRSECMHNAHTLAMLIQVTPDEALHYLDRLCRQKSHRIRSIQNFIRVINILHTVHSVHCTEAFLVFYQYTAVKRTATATNDSCYCCHCCHSCCYYCYCYYP